MVVKVILEKMNKNNGNIEWVVSLKLEDGTRIRGVQLAWYGHPAMDFFRKRKGINKFKAAFAEKKVHFDHFLSEGLRNPLTEAELRSIALEERRKQFEQEQAQIATRLSDANLYRDDPKAALALQARTVAIESALLALLERWELLGGAA